MFEDEDGITRIDFRGINNPESPTRKAATLERNPISFPRGFILPDVVIEELRNIQLAEPTTHESLRYRLSYLLKFTNRDHYLDLIRKYISDGLGIDDISKALACGLSKFHVSEEAIREYSTKFPASKSFLSVIPKETHKALVAIDSNLRERADFDYKPEGEDIFAAAVALEAYIDMIILRFSSSEQLSGSRDVRITGKNQELVSDSKVEIFEVMKRNLAEMICQIIIKMKSPTDGDSLEFENAEVFIRLCKDQVSKFLEDPDSKI